MEKTKYQKNTLFETCSGLGDDLMARWILRDCDETCRVFTKFPFLYKGLKIKPVPPNLLPDTPVSKEHRQVFGGELYTSYPSGIQTRAATNAPSSIHRCGSVMSAMLSNSGQSPEKCYRDFDLPPGLDTTLS